MIGGRRPLPGRKPADRRVRVERPHSPYFRYADAGQLVASEPRRARARAPAGRRAKVRDLSAARCHPRGDRRAALEDQGARDLQLRRDLLVGLRDRGDPARPGPRRRRGAHRLDRDLDRDRHPARRRRALSYRQVCQAFPNGGGAYAVARSELTPLLGLIAAAALLIDYVMTVAVSTSSALDQLASLVPRWRSTRSRSRHRRHHAHHDRQPPRPARVRQHLRRPDLRVRRARARDRRPRAVNIVTGTAHPLPRQPNAEHLRARAARALAVLRASLAARSR